MCTSGPTRRDVLRTGLGAAAAAAVFAVPGRAEAAPVPEPVVVRPGLSVIPRSAWGGDLKPAGALPTEARGDVRFLLVHHTAGTNAYEGTGVAATLRSIYRYHTKDKGWPDVAYNFFVDRYGGVWEGRTGSLGAPVKPDATGGSQGYALLACFVGDHAKAAPTAAATASMASLLAWMADTYAVPTTKGATTTFVSRGSNRWKKGTKVTAKTISGHRDMSLTSCPGDAGYELVVNALPGLVQAERAAVKRQLTAQPRQRIAHTHSAPPA